MLERKSERAATPAALTYGAVAAQLEKNGYVPTSAIAPHGRLADTTPVRLQPHAPHTISEHPPAIFIKSPLVALVLTPLDDQVLAKRILMLFEKRGLTGGPVRLGSDGRGARLLRCESLGLTGHTALDGAVVLDRELNDRTSILHSVLPLDGDWVGGSLLTTPLSKLPVVQDARELFEALNDLPNKIRAERAPPPKPSKRAYLGVA
jgi:hypothetical protein